MTAFEDMDLSYQNQPPNYDLDHVPGERGWPYIGKTYELIANFYGLVDDHYKKYGPISRIRLIGHDSLLCVGAEANRIIYLDSDKNFSPMMGYADNLGEFYGGGLLMRDFDDHRLHRRMFQTAFKTELMKHYTDVMNPVMEENIKSWNNDSNFHFVPHIKTTLLDIAAEVFLGIDDIKGDEAAKMSQTFIEIADGMLGIVRIDSPLFFMTKWRKAKQSRRYMESYIRSQIPERRQNTTKQDMFSLFTRETDTEGNFFPDDDIAAHINFLLFAAHDTTTSNLTYIMQYLGQDLALQNKLREISLGMGKEQLDYEDLAQMVDIEYVHYEALRMRPSVMMMNRRTIRDCEIEGVKIPANTILSIAPQYTHMMPDYWDNPENFDPYRFAPERAEHKRHPFQFIPFGGGAHKCIGMHFAGMNVKTFLHQMLLNYEWKVPDGYNPKHQFVPMPKQADDLPLILKKR